MDAKFYPCIAPEGQMLKVLIMRLQLKRIFQLLVLFLQGLGVTSVDLSDGQSILLFINEGIYNETTNHSLLSEFQLREYGVIIDSICQRHGGTQ